MNKTKIDKAEIKDKIIEFYDKRVWHFSMINGLDLGDRLELQWIFCKRYSKDEPTVFYAEFEYDEVIPSIKDIIPTAWVSEAEIKDLLGANVDGAIPHLFLEADAPKTPLRKNS
ncbi:MAG: NADH-quinone oxidoreductase subunit C [Campylobacterales bacterium]